MIVTLPVITGTVNIVVGVVSGYIEIEPAPTLYRVTTWFTYQLPNGLRGKTSYKGLMSWDMTGYGDYVLTVSMRNVLACLALQGTYPTTITAVSKEEYEK